MNVKVAAARDFSLAAATIFNNINHSSRHIITSKCSTAKLHRYVITAHNKHLRHACEDNACQEVLAALS